MSLSFTPYNHRTRHGTAIFDLVEFSMEIKTEACPEGGYASMLVMEKHLRGSGKN